MRTLSTTSTFTRQTETRPTVLLVDDDGPTRALFSIALRLGGLRVVPVGDGIAALRAIHDFIFDAVVLDLDLPQVNGLAVHEELAADPRTTHIPVVIVSATDWQSNRQPHARLTKPVDPDVLVSTIVNALQRQSGSSA